MKRIILLLAAAAMIFCTSCKKDDANITFTTDNIVVPLGASSADLAKFAKADGSVSVSGVDFEMIGEQTATFKCGGTSVDKTIKVSAAPLAGEYNIHILDSAATQELTQGNGWRMHITKGSAYNQIDIPSAVGENKIFVDIDKLTVTFNGKNGKIANYTGGFSFVQGGGYTIKFQNITYGKNDEGMWAIKGFTLKLTQQGYNDFYEQVRFDKTDDEEEPEE